MNLFGKYRAVDTKPTLLELIKIRLSWLEPSARIGFWNFFRRHQGTDFVYMLQTNFSSGNLHLFTHRLGDKKFLNLLQTLEKNSSEFDFW